MTQRTEHEGRTRDRMPQLPSDVIGARNRRTSKSWSLRSSTYIRVTM